VNAGEAAFALGDQAKVETVLDILQNLPGPAVAGAAGARRPLQRARAGERGEADVAERRFKRAAGLFREIACPFYLAVTQLEQASGSRDRAVPPNRSRCSPSRERSSRG
jgi:hypothetical protein